MKNRNKLLIIYFCEMIIIAQSVKVSAVHQSTEDIDDTEKVKGFVLKTEDCAIPELDAFHSSIKPFLIEKKPENCTNGTSPLVESNLTSIYIQEKAYPDYEISKMRLLMCCYTPFWSKVPIFKGSDFKIVYSRRCVNFSKSASIKHEFIRVECFYDSRQIYIDYFAFVLVKVKEIQNRDGLNVLVVGLDSLSRLNFHRQMPRTASALKKLGGVEFLGFNKVADDLESNLAPLLTGMYQYNFRECLPKRRVYFDTYPFIWKFYHEKNYVTAYIQDTPPSFTCFSKQPTDYDWRVFTSVTLEDTNRSCTGTKETYLVHLEYIQSFVEAMRITKQHYFGFFWESSLTHDVLNTPKAADAKYSNLIIKMNKTGILNETILFVLSDHGVRHDGLMQTFQGKLENKLPFLHVYLPPWYKAKFPLAFGHLMKNKRRLVTLFDVYYTLLDLVDPYKLTSEFLVKRNQSDQIQDFHSLFDVVSRKRTCKSVGVSSKLCAC